MAHLDAQVQGVRAMKTLFYNKLNAKTLAAQQHELLDQVAEEQLRAVQQLE